ncbi:MAG: cation:proton antiporter, partial [Candidatus Aenigmatarchaeota archaeon]
ILGFLGNYLFKKTSIPDILILIFLGFLIGPVFKIVEPTVLNPISQIFASLALVIILFDGGLNLDLKKVLQDSPKASLLAFLGVFVSMAFTALFTRFVLGWDILVGLLLGAIIGGTSSSIVIPLISRIKVDEKISIILSLESAFTDAIVVVFSLTIIQFLTAPATLGLNSIATGIAGAFSIAIIIGLIVGVIWLKILKIIKRETYDDILTLAVVLLFYSITEIFGGNGAIFALTFGLVLGNGIRISRFFGIKKGIEASKVMRKFESQISFFIRTFFFVYLGLIFVVSNFMAVIYSLAIVAILTFGRYLSVVVLSIKDKVIEDNKILMTIMLPRGLAAAVLAQILRNYNIVGTEPFSDIIILTIVYSVVISTIGISILSRKLKKTDGIKK